MDVMYSYRDARELKGCSYAINHSCCRVTLVIATQAGMSWDLGPRQW